MPQPQAGQVRIRTSVCGICATDLEMIKGWSRTGFPAIPGHEWSGVVDAVGLGVSDGLFGRNCVADNVWTDGGEVGFEHPGGYGQFFLTEAKNIQLLPDEFPMEQAALIEPLAVCLRAMRRLRIERKKTTLVFGDGVIGLLMLTLLKRSGVERVTVVGGRAARLAIAEEFGAYKTINYHDAGQGLAKLIMDSSDGEFETVIEACGSLSAVTLAVEIAAKQGKVLVIGDYGQGRADFAWNHLLHRELELIGSNASAGAWDEATSLATGNCLPLGRLISHQISAGQFAEGIELVRAGRDVIKVILDWREVSS